jgi:lipopolysaccharide transport system permease protein
MLSSLKTSYFLSLMDLSTRFRAAKLGIHWFYIQQLVWALGAGAVWSVVFGIPLQEFLPFIIVSFNAWNFIASFIVDSSAVFQNSSGYLKNTNIAPYIYVNKVFVSAVIIFIISLIPLLILSPFVEKRYLDVNFLQACISMVFVIICLAPVAYFIAFVGVIVRDLTPALQSLFQILFIASPVIYPPAMIKNKGYEWALDLNPFFHILEIIRQPILSGTLAGSKHIVVLACIGLTFLFINYLFIRQKFRRVALYV